MIGARAKISGPGRKPKLQVVPVANVFGSHKDFLMFLVDVFKMTPAQAVDHMKMSFDNFVFVTQYARVECDYQVLVRKGFLVPQQGEAGVDVAHVLLRRVDGKTGPFDWDDMQDIKEAIFGKEVEAVELFPKWSRRLRENKEFRHMWVFPDGHELPIGFPKDAYEKKFSPNPQPKTGSN